MEPRRQFRRQYSEAVAAHAPSKDCETAEEAALTMDDDDKMAIRVQHKEYARPVPGVVYLKSNRALHKSISPSNKYKLRPI